MVVVVVVVVVVCRGGVRERDRSSSGGVSGDVNGECGCRPCGVRGDVGVLWWLLWLWSCWLW